jgi:hypothetical protein
MSVPSARSPRASISRFCAIPSPARAAAIIAAPSLKEKATGGRRRKVLPSWLNAHARCLDARIGDAAVVVEIIGRRRHTAPREVVRRGEPHEPGGAERNALPARRRDVADAQDDVEAVQPEERAAITEREVEDDVGVGFLEFGKRRDYEGVADRCRQVEPNAARWPPAWLQGRFGHTIGFDRRPRVVEELAPVLGQVDPPRRPIEQPRADALLQPGDMERHHRRGDAQMGSGSGERASLGDGKEGFQSGQSIHDYYPMANISARSGRHCQAG